MESPLTSAAAVWAALVGRAGIEERLKDRVGRDYELADAVRDALAERLQVPLHGRALTEVLASGSPEVSVELLLRCTLTAIQPFAAMMREVLQTLVRADAGASGDALQIRFDFSPPSDSLTQTLAQFRHAVQLTRRALGQVEIQVPPADLVWAISQQLLDVVPDGWRQDEGKWGSTEPAVPSPPSGFPPLDALLSAVVDMVNAIRRWLLDIDASGDRDRIRRTLEQAAMLQPGAPAEARLQLGRACHDVADQAVLAAAGAVVRAVQQRRVDPAAIVQRLQPLVAQIPRQQRWIDETYRLLLDVLNLPVWSKRSELYAVWIGCRLLAAIDSGDPALQLQLHAPDGILSFAFGGAKLASYNQGSKRHDLWTELRTPLEHGSNFKVRSEGIQPDYRVVDADAWNQNDGSVLVLECKHYLDPKPANFVSAADDYARNCRHARVLLANHGRLDETDLLSRTPVSSRARVRYLGNVQATGHDAQVATLESEIHAALFDKAALPAASVLAASIEISWQLPLGDIDLILVHVDPGGRRSDVGFRSPGSATAAPFAHLLADVRQGPGAETIEIYRWLPGSYEIWVSDYSRSGLMARGVIECTIQLGRNRVKVHYPGPADGSNHWLVATVSGDQPEFEIKGQAFTELPTGIP